MSLQYLEEKNISFIKMSFYLFIKILCAKMSSVYKPLGRAYIEKVKTFLILMNGNQSSKVNVFTVDSFSQKFLFVFYLKSDHLKNYIIQNEVMHQQEIMYN